MLVCGGVLVLQNKKDIPRGKFRTPYLNGKFIYPILVIGSIILAFTVYRTETMSFITNQPKVKGVVSVLEQLNPVQIEQVKGHILQFHSEENSVPIPGLDSTRNIDLEVYYSQMGEEVLVADMNAFSFEGVVYYDSGFALFAHKIPFWIFILFAFAMVVVTFRHKLSMIPLMGLLACLYMMSQIELKNWIAFVIWLLVGLVIYFVYSRKKSKLGQKSIDAV